MRITLVGYRAVGKSTVGRLLARRLGVPFEDADVALERRSGRAIADIFRDEGEAAFRDLEAATLEHLLEGTHGLVLATGGGACLRADNRALLQRAGGTVVYLQAPVALLQERLRRHAGGRPSLTGVPVADEVPAILAVRDPLYRATATVTVEITANATVDAVADAVIRALPPT